MEVLTKSYAAALREYLNHPSENGLAQAYELSRRALAEGIGVLDFATVHRNALGTVLSASDPQCASAIRSLEFLGEALAPFEMAHRGFREATTVLRQLNERLESEVRRIAHSLHDEVAQLLVGVYIGIEEVRREVPEAAGERLAGVLGLVDEISDEVRALSHELRPTALDDLGLVPALELLGDALARRSQLQVVVRGSGVERLDPALETATYRIVQEALANVRHHAAASRVEVEVEPEDGSLRLEVCDDGVGFDVEAVRKGLGLVGMRERVQALGGALRIQSTPGRGTTVHVSIPIQPVTGGSRRAEPPAAG